MEKEAYPVVHKSLVERLRVIQTELQDLARGEIDQGNRHDSPEYALLRERAQHYRAGARYVLMTIEQLDTIEQHVIAHERMIKLVAEK